MKKILCFLLCLVLMFTFVGCGESATETGADTSSASASASGKGEDFVLTPAEEVTSFKDTENTIICWGDSITQGAWMDKGYSYPEQLQANIGNQFKVINAGVPGENCLAIMSRAQIVEKCLTNDVTFKAGEASVTLDCYLFSEVGGETIEYHGFGNKLPFDNITIDGKPYTIKFVAGKKETDGQYILTRSDSATALTLKKGAKVEFDYSKYYKNDYCNIILIGANDGKTPEGRPRIDLIPKFKEMAAMSDKYIIIVPFYYKQSLTAEFEAEFGDHIVKAREYFINGALDDYGLQPHQRDERFNVTISNTLTYSPNDSHLSENGYKILADMVYEKGVDLGYWS